VRFLAVCTALASCLLAQNPREDAENGRKLYEQFGCYTCHGRLGQGSAAGPRIAPRPVATAALIAYVRRPTGQMPPFTETVISDAQLADIRAYLASIPEPPPLKDLPLLNQ
jgi:ubiquinol-cytochrome c reductase cytochrome c subunit